MASLGISASREPKGRLYAVESGSDKLWQTYLTSPDSTSKLSLVSFVRLGPPPPPYFGRVVPVPPSDRSDPGQAVDSKAVGHARRPLRLNTELLPGRASRASVLHRLLTVIRVLQKETCNTAGWYWLVQHQPRHAIYLSGCHETSREVSVRSLCRRHTLYQAEGALDRDTDIRFQSWSMPPKASKQH